MFRTQSRMIMKTGPAGSAQSLGKTFHHATRGAVQDSALPGVPLKKMFYLGQDCFSFRHTIMQIGAVETADKTPCSIQFQGFTDFLAGVCIGRCRDGNARDFGILVGQHGQLSIFRTKIMSPFGNAMTLIDGKQPHLPPLVQGLQGGLKRVLNQTLGCQIEEFQFMSPQGMLNVSCFSLGLKRVEACCSNSAFSECLNLILHQGDERGNDQGHAGSQQSGDLVAQRFAPAGGHQHQRIFPALDMIDHLLLEPAKFRVCKSLAQNFQCRVHDRQYGRSPDQERHQ